MSRHFSNWHLNTYSSTAYFDAHVPRNYPLLETLAHVRVFRNLPPNLKKLSALAKQWAMRKYPENPAGIEGIEDWYDDEGYELDPATGERLTAAEIAEDWPSEPYDPNFVVKDIPVPKGGLADPETWEKPPPEEEEEDGPTIEQIVKDVKSHGLKRTAKEYGLTEKQLEKMIEDSQWINVENVFCPTGPGGGVDPTCGLGGSAGTMGNDPLESDPHHLGVKMVADDIRKEWGYHGKVNVYNQLGREFEVGGVKWKEGGNCVLSDGTVTIHSQSAGKEIGDIKRLMSHELMHGTFEKVYQQYEAERKKLEEPADTKTGVKMRYDGDPYPQFAHEVPVYAKLRPMLEESSKLIAEDGITPYSKAYWKDYQEGKGGYHIAVHETLAEIAAEHQRTGEVKGAKIWRDLYKAVRSEYKIMTGQAKRRVPAKKAVENAGDYHKFFDKDLNPCPPEDAAYLSTWKADGSHVWAVRQTELSS